MSYLTMGGLADVSVPGRTSYASAGRGNPIAAVKSLFGGGGGRRRRGDPRVGVFFENKRIATEAQDEILGSTRSMAVIYDALAPRVATALARGSRAQNAASVQDALVALQSTWQAALGMFGGVRAKAERFAKVLNDALAAEGKDEAAHALMQEAAGIANDLAPNLDAILGEAKTRATDVESRIQDLQGALDGVRVQGERDRQDALAAAKARADDDARRANLQWQSDAQARTAAAQQAHEEFLAKLQAEADAREQARQDALEKARAEDRKFQRELTEARAKADADRQARFDAARQAALDAAASREQARQQAEVALEQARIAAAQASAQAQSDAALQALQMQLQLEMFQLQAQAQARAPQGAQGWQEFSPGRELFGLGEESKASGDVWRVPFDEYDLQGLGAPPSAPAAPDPVQAGAATAAQMAIRELMARRQKRRPPPPPPPPPPRARSSALVPILVGGAALGGVVALVAGLSRRRAPVASNPRRASRARRGRR